MAMSPAGRVELAGTSLDSLLTIKNDQLTAWLSAGMPPTFSVEGESYSYGEWLAAIDAAIEAALRQRTRVGGPWMVRSRQRG